MLFKWIAVFAISATLAETIELAFPQNGDNFCPSQEVTAQVIQPQSMASTVQVGIALGIANCENGSCPDPADGLGSYLYAGPWTSEAMGLLMGPAIFTLTHFCLIGADWYPFLEFRNATVNIK
ncbi:uncharacterized protein F5147DRAFT_767396 [Suillus discolor]|uniref:Uncharacterized protein n=1 Tax=Suillus discolor TaxID=1912936 RepID=A0A9P7FJ45_9AGAM|nr:uncharacterized protein F5147DRAFT_767396 [Suillus discolor]KAG2119933.1 hypothetical protein F5147DRAFT_767396 [Suillus discolor]